MLRKSSKSKRSMHPMRAVMVILRRMNSRNTRKNGSRKNGSRKAKKGKGRK
jgi:hypothetical protein